MSILAPFFILGRFGFDGDNLERSGLFQYITRGSKVRSINYPKLDITFMTVHSSKGLGYDNVIVINGRNETYGFPSKIEDDPVLQYVIKHDRSIEYAEERRLFYVAMTRTKNRVFFIAPEQNPSEFLLEIKRDYKSVLLQGNWNDQEYQPAYRNICPICGYPLQFRYKNSYGLRLYICTNEPELCGFLTNDLKGKKMSIQKCNKCSDGYLIVKRSNSGQKQPFIGCTNYSRDGKGCSNSLDMKSYYSKYDLTEDITEKTESKELTAQVKQKKIQDSSINEKNSVSNTNTMHTEQPVIAKRPGSITTSAYDTQDAKIGGSVEPESMEEKVALESIKYNGMDMLDVIGKIINCVREISEIHFFGKGILLNVLRGSNNKKLLKYELERTSNYGKLVYLQSEEIELIIDWLIAEGFLLQRNSRYPVLQLTYNGINYKETMTNKQLKDLAKLIIENWPDSRFSIEEKVGTGEVSLPVFAGVRWTTEEDNQLLDEIQAGLTVKQIAKIHSRSNGAIKSRIEKLNGKD